jgi:hypothetical protein
MASVLFKTPRQLQEFYNCEALLQEILYWIVDFQWPENVPMSITSIYRTVAENNDAGAKTQIHCQTPHRAADISLRLVPENVANKITAEVNRRWDYGNNGFPCAYTHNVGSGIHLHVQVHKNTKRRT